MPAVRTTAKERVARWLYGALWYVATPLVAGYLLWRSRRQPAYRRHWGERFLGRYPAPRPASCLWLHAVSVGETRAAAPLVEALLAAHPTVTVVVTHMTPTGRETAETLFGDRVRHAYLAYDYPHAVAAFLRHWRPRVGIVMETEIWPDLMAAADHARVPMLLANARLSERSLLAAERWSSLMRPASRRFARILAQTEADARRLALLSGSHEPASIVVTGNVKFDLEVGPSQQLVAETFGARLRASPATRVFLCASTREGEEEAILAAWRRNANSPEVGRLLVIVPRHPQRFEAVVATAVAQGFRVQRRSDDAVVSDDTEVWIGDSMGELAAYYLAADVAYVGGSIVPRGGQNLIEAAACGCPILIGPHTFNFAAASDDAVRAGAALRVDDFDQLIVQGIALASDDPRRSRMSAAGLAFAAAHRGATARTVEIVEETLRAWGSDASISSS